VICPTAVVVGALVVEAGTVVVAAVVVVTASASVVDAAESFPSLDELQPTATSTKAMDAPNNNQAFNRTLPESDESPLEPYAGLSRIGQESNRRTHASNEGTGPTITGSLGVTPVGGVVEAHDGWISERPA
jgi:hypothetical protein